MPRGCKTCSKCEKTCGPRCHACPHCDSTFEKSVNKIVSNPVKTFIATPKEVERLVDIYSSETPYLTRLKILEDTNKTLREQLRTNNSILTQVLNILKTFHEIPKSLMLHLRDGQWYGMNDEREEYPVQIGQGDSSHISFALAKAADKGATTAPWDEEVAFTV